MIKGILKLLGGFPKPAANPWRKIDDLPPCPTNQDEREDEEEERCIITWQDEENPADIGMEINSLSNIRDGDYNDERYGTVYWKSAMDCPAVLNPKIVYRNDE